MHNQSWLASRPFNRCQSRAFAETLCLVVELNAVSGSLFFFSAAIVNAPALMQNQHADNTTSPPTLCFGQC
ncbi:hypothetical protein K432DRAFT_213757 [Lepidopterella palustris CBS 459.81]|uniref:Uncharacterized protein n=1 Tax=Lepidopterella palustris CBS 459.81 TaxID=1314670 RepID=A0A8E2EF30_9PEZI|nr:hypothetical protein K432DRAFT_213757 [Lepidopterella palustris CBS 459.81]